MSYSDIAQLTIGRIEYESRLYVDFEDVVKCLSSLSRIHFNNNLLANAMLIEEVATAFRTCLT